MSKKVDAPSGMPHLPPRDSGARIKVEPKDAVAFVHYRRPGETATTTGHWMYVCDRCLQSLYSKTKKYRYLITQILQCEIGTAKCSNAKCWYLFHL